MRVLWVCNIMLPVIAQALSQEYSVREGWLSGILGRYLETENGAELSIADVTDSAASPGGRQQGAETAAALTLGIAFPVAPGREELSQRLQLGSYKKKSPAMALQRIWSTRSAMTARWKRVFADFRGLSAGFGAYLRDGVPAWLCLCESISQTGADACGLAGTLYFLCGQLHGRSPGKCTEQQDTARCFKKDSIRQQQEKFYQRAENEKNSCCQSDM